MRINRKFCALMTFAGMLTGLMAIGVAPASAATFNTTVSLDLSQKYQEYDGTIGVGGTTTVAGTQDPVYYGTLKLQRKLKGGSWTTLQTDTTPSTFYFVTKAKGNAKYRAQYVGGTYSVGTYNSSMSTTKSLKVLADLKLTEKKTRAKYIVKGKIKPKKAHKWLKAYKKVNGKWKKYKRLKIKKGKFKIGFPYPARVNTKFKWKFELLATKRFIKRRVSVTTTRVIVG